MKCKYLIAFFLTTVCLVSCSSPKKKTISSKALFGGFENPPAEARPFVRWWWNGNHLSEKEIVRQLEVLHTVGIGGVEINPIAMPPGAKDIGTKSLVWLSEEWNRMLVFAAKEAKKKGMITDLIVGSGWPFGGEFVKSDETIKRLTSNKIQYSGGSIISENEESLYRKLQSIHSAQLLREKAESYELYFVRLVPIGITDVSQIIDLTGDFKNSKVLTYKVPPGHYELVYGFLEKSVREVMYGAPGAAGPVMNHYEKEITMAYLNRLRKISDDTGIPLKKLIRALFCDSIELAGANWTDGFEDLFFQTYNYRIEPYFPFVFYDPYQGYLLENYEKSFMDSVKRVRYDFHKLLVNVFLDNFTRVFHEFCTENGLQSRYQAYGTPFLMGIMDGNMIADIPESNNWVYSSEMQGEKWTWNQSKGTMIWNMYAASGGHLTGKKIISNEAMTNTQGVFKTSLDEIKQHDDMNFITGNNHTILHGYNYSPPEAGFPGWIRFGSYFNEKNTWWPYFSKWVEYNARLSYIFQNSSPVKNIAVLAPQGDVWSEGGLTRVKFHITPWYCHRLWEPLSQSGSSCDYISEKILQEGISKEGKFNYGPMSYQAIILTGIKSLEAETALALIEFVHHGGKLVIIGEMPMRSLSMVKADENDKIVKDSFLKLIFNNTEKVFALKSPQSEKDLQPLVAAILEKINIETDVKISKPDNGLYQIRKKAGEMDIYFFTNTKRYEAVSINAIFPTENKTPWVWNPEEGTRKVFQYGNNKNELSIELQPLQSLLLVFDPDKDGSPVENEKFPEGQRKETLYGTWNASFEHINGESFTRHFDTLTEFGTSIDAQLSTFAGTVNYSSTFTSDGTGLWLELGKVNKGVSEVFINGKSAGLNWYGRPLFKIKGLFVKGENLIEIKYTNVLSNYAMSLKGNETAAIWTNGFELIPSGLDGDVVIY
jgi:hypothetical protein